jgi:hypothetical protein
MMKYCPKCLWLAIGVTALLTATMALGQSIPTPQEFVGHPIGAEKKLVRWDKIIEYMQVVANGSDRVIFDELGKSTDGNPLIMMVISSAANLGNIEHYRDINRRLFDPRTIASDEEAAQLIEEGKLFVLITCSLHATEIGASQMSLELVHQLATESTPRIRSILDNVVFLLVPSLNPDGNIMVTDWYRKTLGTPHEDAPMPWLYHRYVGHDNNRDAYMFTQRETQLIGKVLYEDWLPQVWLDEHQMGNRGARMFVMPAADPINPNVDPLIYRNAGLLGFGQAAALERAGKHGIIYARTYTYWWEGAMAWTGWWHNMIGMLTEVASARLATPVEQRMADPNNPPPQQAGRGRRRGSRQDPASPLPPPTDVQYRSEYPRPWLGGRWTLRDIVDYELIATLGLLETGAGLRRQLLDGLYTVGKRQLEMGKRGDPFAVLIPKDQADQPTAVKMLQILAMGGLEIHRARAPFNADGVRYPAGTYAIMMEQPFRPYAKDMLEPQVYPQISPAPGLPPSPPYDVAGWSLGMQMGVETNFIKDPFEADLELLERVDLPPGEISGTGSAYILSHKPNNSLVAVNRLLKRGFQVTWAKTEVMVDNRSYSPGAIFVQGGSDLPEVMAEVTRSLGIDAKACRMPDVEALTIGAPRTALYQPWGGNMDEGWTRWLLEEFEFPYTTIHPEDLRAGNPSERFDVIIFSDVRDTQILQGLTGRNVPEQYRGGIEEAGLGALRSFVQGGGTVLTLGRSSKLMMDKFALPYRDALGGVSREEFFCPGSILSILVDPEHPIGYGMPHQANAFFANSMALEQVPSFSTMETSIVVRYPTEGLLKSGWLRGDPHLHNKVGVAEVKWGRGRIVLLPLRVQNRAQPHGTFKLLFNSILTSALK